MHKKGLKLAACLLNISEAKSYDKVEKIARAAVSQYENIQTPIRDQQNNGLLIETSVLDIYPDQLHNISVITIAGELLNPKLVH